MPLTLDATTSTPSSLPASTAALLSLSMSQAKRTSTGSRGAGHAQCRSCRQPPYRGWSWVCNWRADSGARRSRGRSAGVSPRPAGARSFRHRVRSGGSCGPRSSTPRPGSGRACAPGAGRVRRRGRWPPDSGRLWGRRRSPGSAPSRGRTRPAAARSLPSSDARGRGWDGESG